MSKPKPAAGNFAIAKSEIAKLQFVASVVRGQMTVPILHHVLLSASPTAMHVTATTLDIEVTCDVSGKGRGEWQATAPARLISGVVGAAEEDVSIEPDGEDLVLSAGRARHRLRGLPADDFPALQRDEDPAVIEFSAEDFSFLFGTVAYAMSDEQTRIYLNGIYLHALDGRLKACATNGHVLALAELPGEDLAPDLAGIVSREAIGVMLKARGDDFKLSVGPRKAQLDGGGTTILSKLVAGTFPDYQRVIPQPGAALGATVAVDALAGALRQVMPLCSEKARPVKIECGDGSLLVSVRNPDAGDSQVSVPAEVKGDIIFGVNGGYLGDMLKALPDGVEQIAIALASPGDPIRFDPVGRSDCLFVIMPLRV